MTEFEKIEMGMFDKIFTVGKVRRSNQYSVADAEGQYLVKAGEQIGYRYEVVQTIDSGAFGTVIRCVDFKDPAHGQVAIKISKNKKFDVDNALVEIKILKKLGAEGQDDDEGRQQIVEMLDSFRFRQHVVIIFECLGHNLYKFMQLNRRRQPMFAASQLRAVARQSCQALKYMQNIGVIHCDMKPENILFTDSTFQNIKIIDFGASCEDCTTGFFYV